MTPTIRNFPLYNDYRILESMSDKNGNIKILEEKLIIISTK